MKKRTRPDTADKALTAPLQEQTLWREVAPAACFVR